jgi:hypothetical protein
MISLDRVQFVMEKQYVFCDTGNEYLYIIYTNVKFKSLKQSSCLQNKNEQYSVCKI